MFYRQIKFSALFCIALVCISSCSTHNHSLRPKPITAKHTLQNEEWKSLSLREKIGQTMMINMDHEGHQQQFGSIQAMMQQYPVGGIFIPQWRYSAHKPESDIIPHIRRAIRLYEDGSRYPIFVSEDFERGLGESYSEFTRLPPEMSVGAANSPALAKAFGEVVSSEAKALGVNWLLHPVADLNMNPLNNLILDRAVSDDANKAYPLLHSQILGMRNNGVIATIKHFPGDGATMKNQHLVTSNNTLSINEWNQSFGTLYQQLINDDAPSIMVGHIRFPAYQRQALDNGMLPPATLSSELITKLLKDEMQFKGVVMTDALNMGGIGGYYPNALETAVQTFIAGADMVLWPDLEYMDEIEKRILSGEIPISRLNDAVERIWLLREKFDLLKKKSALFSDLSDEQLSANKNTAKTIAEHAITLIEDRNNILPLNPKENPKIALISLSFDNGEGQFQQTANLLRAKGFEVAPIIHNPFFYSWQNRIEELKQYDKIIVAFGNRNSDPMGNSMLKGEESMGVWTANFLPFDKVIAISYGNPYYSGYYLETAATKINAYGYDEFTQAAVVEALTGGIPFKGISPVKLDHSALQ